MTKYLQKIAKGGSIAFIVMVATAAVGYLFRRLLADNLSIEDFGLFFAVFSFVNMFYGFKGFGTGPAYVRFVSEYKVKNRLDEIKRVFLTFTLIQVVIFGVLSILVVLFSSYLAQYYFKTEKAIPLLIILTFAFISFIFITSFRGIFQGFQKIGLYTAVDLMQTVVVLISTFVLLRFGFTITAPAWAYLISFVIVAIICFIFMLRIFPIFKIKAPPNKKTFVKLVKFGIPVTFATIGSSMISSIDVATLTYFRSLQEVGLYSIAVPIVNMIKYVPKALSTIIFPVSAELYFKSKQKLADALTELYKYLFIIIIPISFAVFAFSDEIINILFGEKFIAASPALKILAVGMAFATIYMVNQNIFFGIDKPKKFAKMIFIETIISTVLDLSIIPFFGFVGAAVSTSITLFAMLIISSITINNHIHNKIPWKEWGKTVVAGIIFIFIIFLLKRYIHMNIYIEAGLILFISGLAYLAIIFVFRLITIDEAKKLFNRFL